MNFEHDMTDFFPSFSKAFCLLAICWWVVPVENSIRPWYMLLKIRGKMTLAPGQFHSLNMQNHAPQQAYLSIFY